MQTLIKSEKVILKEKTKIGTDSFGQDVFEVVTVTIEDVVVGTPSTTDIESAIEVYGKRLAYSLGIPKGDTHNWIDAEVVVRGLPCKVVGIPLEYTEGSMPSWWKWNKRVDVEFYG